LSQGILFSIGCRLDDPGFVFR